VEAFLGREGQMTEQAKSQNQAGDEGNTPPTPKRVGSASAIPFWRLVRPQIGVKQFFLDLFNEMFNHDVTNSAAVLAYFSMLAIFPAAILVLSVLPYLPIPNLGQTIIIAMHRAMPSQAAEVLTSTVARVVSEPHGGLLSLGALGAVWAASSGIQTIMEQIHATYNEKETRPYWKRRLIAIGLVFGVGLLVLGAFVLVVIGGIIYDQLARLLGENSLLLKIFLPLRWITAHFMMLGALSLLYYYGPDVRQHYRLVTPGGLLATMGFVIASLLFRAYVANFGSYEATYGSLGAAIVLLLWLYVSSLVILIGSEVNGLLERYARLRGVQTPTPLSRQMD
jgi:membrane protein